MDTSYEIDILDRPGRQWTEEAIARLQDELCQLGSLCLNSLPEYQVFDRSSRGALDDKLIATARKNGEIIAAVSAIWLSIPGFPQPILHTGLTLVHPKYRNSGVNVQLIGTQWLYVLRLYPKGLWLSTLAEVETQALHIF
ncbi:membrane protein [Seiridium cupressi]